jgi:hypothetical protein
MTAKRGSEGYQTLFAGVFSVFGSPVVDVLISMLQPSSET